MERPMQVNVKEKNIKNVARAETQIPTEPIKKQEKIEENKEDSKKEKIEIKRIKKTEAVVNVTGLPVSTKHSIAICNLIRNKNIDYAIMILEEVKNFRRAVPMKGEIPHRRGDMMSGRYPIKASGEFIKILKSLKSNAIANELELEKYVIFCKSDIGSRPYRKSGRARGKRTNVQLKLILPLKNKNKEEKK